MAGEVTELLAAWSGGDRSAFDRLVPIVYAELRRIAARARRREAPGLTLQTTALVHEAYLRLVDQGRGRFATRAQFFAVAAQAMRRILVDQARRRLAEKRGGGRPLQLGADVDVPVIADAEVLAVDAAVLALQAIDADLARLVELRFFGGLTVDESASTNAGGLEGGFAQIDDVELVCEPLFADAFESGDTSAWSQGTANACPAPTGGPTLHANSVLANETWTANASPHILTANVLVPAGVTLTVAPCAEVRIRPGVDLTVRGTLVSRGTPLQRIGFRRDNPALPWNTIWVKSPGFADLSFANVSGGGSAGAAVTVEGVDTLPAALPLLADHLTVLGSAGHGLRLFRRAGFAVGSRDLAVSGSGATDATAPFPVRMSLNTVGTLPVGTYTGNASDVIQVIGEGGASVEVDDTFHDRGVPYQIGGPPGSFGLIVVDGDPTLATLTLDPGVEIRFYTAGGGNYGGLFVGTSASPVATGRIVAAGTADEPILFTGAGGAPVAGYWEGITFLGALAAGNLLDHVQIDAAGAHGGDQGFGCPPSADGNQTDGALKIFSQPGAQFLTHSTISRSSTHGVFRAWVGAQVDFLAGNTFTDVAFCNQVLPKPPPPATCPADPACPQ